jgi:hypothetical protein
VGTDTYAQVAAGQYHSLGLRADGSLWAWGYNRYGQLGTTTNSGTTNANPTPMQVAGTYTQVAAGDSHSLGLRADGSLYTWGLNSSGQLGNGSTSIGATPTLAREATLGTGWTTLGTGSMAASSLVRTASAQRFASAGQNSSGQLGDGTITNATRFDRVSPLTSLQPLPVALTQFTATAAGPTAVRLVWATATEKNSRAFEVERSVDGERFERLGTVADAGNSSAPRRYGFEDPHTPIPSDPHTLLYYRLKQVDLDGTFAYSPVRTVSFTHSAIPPFTLFPNPARDLVTVATGTAGAAVEVFDATGRRVAQATADASGTTRLRLPVGLAAGRYGVRSGTQAQRLTVE